MSKNNKEKSIIESMYDVSVDKLSAGGKALMEVASRAGKLYNDVSPAILAWSETKARLIKARGEGEIQKIEMEQKMRDAGMRVIAKEMRADENVKSAISLAAESISDNVPKENIKDLNVDWMTSWMESAGRVSEKRIQSLWAGILAGKAQNPNSFSLKTISILRDMDKDSADKFMDICHFVTDTILSTDSIDCLIYDYNHPVYENHNISFTLLNEVVSLGLVVRPALSYYQTIPHFAGPEVIFLYRGEYIMMTLKHAEPHKEYRVDLGEVCLTTAGEELFSLVRKTHEVKCPDFLKYLMEKWKKDGLKPRKVSEEEIDAMRASQGFPPIFAKTPS